MRDRLAACRLYLVTDDETPAERLPQLVAAAVAGGVEVVQLRRKGVAPARLVQLAGRCRDAARAGGALFIVNDHLELALEVGADGLHLGQGDADPLAARRRLGPDPLLGISTHSLAEAVAGARRGADYLGIGPVHPTPIKPEGEAVGLGEITRVARAISLPLVAIGGLGPGRAGAAIAAGADMVAVVRAICSAPRPELAAAELRREIAAAPGWSRVRVDGEVRKVAAAPEPEGAGGSRLPAPGAPS